MSDFSDRLDYELDNVNYEGHFDEIIKIKKARSKKMKISICTSALAVVAAVAVTFSSQIGGLVSSQKTGNGFIMSVNAAEVTASESAKLQLNESVFSMCENDDGKISYMIPLDLSCKGDNISTITYSVENAALSVSAFPDKNSVVSGEINYEYFETPEYDNIKFPLDGDDDLADRIETTHYSSFTVNYDNQIDENMSIALVGISDPVNNTDKKVLLDTYDNVSVSDENEVIGKLLDGVIITCTVKYNNGEEQIQKLKVGTKVMKPSEAFPEDKDEFEGLTDEQRKVKDAEDVFITFELIK